MSPTPPQDPAKISPSPPQDPAKISPSPPQDPTQILLVNPVRGSHFFFMLDIGKVLANAGYNVTLITLDPDSRAALPSSDPLFRVITPSESSFMYNVEFHNRSEECVKQLAEDYSAEEGMSMSVRVPACRDTVLDMYGKSLEFFHGTQWKRLREENDFKLIVAEERTVWAASLAYWGSGIPVAMVNPEHSYILPKVKHQLPLLFNNEPGMLNIHFHENKGLFLKLQSLVSAMQMIPFAMQLNEIFKPFLDERNLTSLNDVTKTIDLFLVNDYPSFSFPYKLPPTVVKIGTLGYSSSTALPSYLTEFLTKDSKETIYLSFGSYVASDLDWLERYSLFMEAAKVLDMKIIISLGSEEQSFSKIFRSDEQKSYSEGIFSSDHVYVSKWLPQKALLDSGHVTLFVSHCGSNSRMEGIYYQVPILCIPLYAEQIVIANIIKYRGFGNILPKENLTPSNILQSLNTTLQHGAQFRAKMGRAVKVLELSPITIEENLVYHVKLLLELGELPYLENDVLEGKSVVDANNLDVLGLVVLVAAVVLWIVVGVIKEDSVIDKVYDIAVGP
ncbi:putative UDP-glucuronosyltransferase ugt-50 [Bolinopsis microptera]|uniref:putative UDP-glucuronosyltransferase ugt-50 n=1 Tax=Bolinopsis microptera TaxID=2820187 RepID=UPI00307AAD64